jgi:hypothetical protein
MGGAAERRALPLARMLSAALEPSFSGKKTKNLRFRVSCVFSHLPCWCHAVAVRHFPPTQHRIAAQWAKNSTKKIYIAPPPA